MSAPLTLIVSNAGYPTERIEKNSHDYRPLGLGYANLGALLMSLGIPYDSDQGRNYSGAITAIMAGQGYLTSAKIAGELGYPVVLKSQVLVGGRGKAGGIKVVKSHGQNSIYPNGMITLKRSELNLKGRKFLMDKGKLIFRGDVIPAIDMKYTTFVEPYKIDVILRNDFADNSNFNVQKSQGVGNSC